jgi:hypothetical protein
MPFEFSFSVSLLWAYAVLHRAYKFSLSVSLWVRMKQLEIRWVDLHEILRREISRKTVETFLFSFRSDMSNGELTCRTACISARISLNVCRQQECFEQISKEKHSAYFISNTRVPEVEQKGCFVYIPEQAYSEINKCLLNTTPIMKEKTKKVFIEFRTRWNQICFILPVVFYITTLKYILNNL